MDNQPSFHFGIELELLLGSRKKTHTTWKSLAKDLSKRLHKAGISNHINESNDKSPANYREWSIAQEVTIPSQPSNNLFGLELVSPIYTPSHPWSQTLSTIFSLLNTHFTLLPSPNTSTHIHISRHPPFPPLSLAHLSKCILTFESALDSLFPSRSSYWCQSNRLSPPLRQSSLPACLAAVDLAGSSGEIRAVVEVMNLFPAASAYGRAHGQKKDFVRGKVYKWDLTGCLVGGRGDVEFRQAPGSLCAEEAVGWVILGVAFVAGAVAVGDAGLGVMGEGEEGTREELWEMLCAGAREVGCEGLGVVEELFTGGREEDE